MVDWGGMGGDIMDEFKKWGLLIGAVLLVWLIVSCAKLVGVI